MISSYDTLNNIPEISFTGGTNKTFLFTAYQENGLDLLDITTGSATWLLCPYGQFDTTALSKAATITDANHFSVTLEPADTILLSGKYIQQAKVTDSTGKIFRPGQGVVIILHAVPES